MFKKYIALLILSIGCAAFAQAGNSILSTSIRKTAENKLNLTFYTKGDSAEKPIVKDKGANQYVILLPNFVDAGRKPDLKNAADIVSDVNVKTINEGAVTYTKVSITTKKPVTINAESRKTTQSAGDLSGVNDIISKVNLISEDIQSSKSIPAAAPVQAAAPAMPKLTSVQDILNNKNSIGTVKPAVAVKKELPAPALSTPVKSVSAHVPANTSAIKADVKKLKNENIKNVRQDAVKNIDKLENNIKNSVKNNVTVNDEEPEIVIPQVNDEAVVQQVVPEPIAEKSGFSAAKFFASPMFLITLLIFGLGILITSIIAKMKSAFAESSEIDQSFIERMNSAAAAEKHDFSHIAENKEMNWQEKYNSLKGDEKEQQIAMVNTYAGVEPDEDLDIVETSADESDSIAEMPNLFAAAVKNSEDVMSRSMKRSLKIADEEVSLSKTRRNTGLKNRFKGFAASPAEGLQRNMSELLDTMIKMEEERPVIQPAVIEQRKEAPAPVQQAVNEIVSHASAPIQKAQPKKKMKIKQSRAIDDNKGFYLVDMEDKLALMGRINDKFTVLKKFDDKDKQTLQVRRDKDNLYMVRTDGFKALVDVAESRMGVLAEL